MKLNIRLGKVEQLFIYSLMYKKVADAQYRSKLSNELMMYHMKVSLRCSIFYIKNLK